MKTLFGQRVINYIRVLQMPKEDLIDIIEIAVDELCNQTGTDIRAEVQKLLLGDPGEPQATKPAGSENPYRGRYSTVSLHSLMGTGGGVKR